MKRYEILPACSAAVVAMALATFAVEIPVNVPERGYVSVQIRNAAGETVGNVITQEPLEKGKGFVDWDLTGPDDGVRRKSYSSTTSNRTLSSTGQIRNSGRRAGETPLRRR